MFAFSTVRFPKAIALTPQHERWSLLTCPVKIEVFHSECFLQIRPAYGALQNLRVLFCFVAQQRLSRWCRVALNWILPHSVWRSYPETGKFRRDRREFEEAPVDRE